MIFVRAPLYGWCLACDVLYFYTYKISKTNSHKTVLQLVYVYERRDILTFSRSLDVIPDPPVFLECPYDQLSYTQKRSRSIIMRRNIDYPPVWSISLRFELLNSFVHKPWKHLDSFPIPLT